MGYPFAFVFDWRAFWDSRGPLSEGLVVTIELTVLTMALAIVGGLTLALLRLSRWNFIRIGATGFVEFFRATPLLLQVYWFYFVLPATFGIRLSAFLTGLVGLTLNVSAFNSETFRAGILSIRPGQRMAAQALGMTSTQVFVRVILPQAARRVIPPLASTWVSLFKDTSLVSTIAVADLSFKALVLRTQNYRVLEVLTAMALIYVGLGYPQARLSEFIYKRFRVVE